MLATDPALVAAAPPEERQRAHEILWNVLPISSRAAGLLNDARIVSTPQRIALDRIRAPTLVVSLKDDYYRTTEPARFISKRIPGARLLIYPTGGYIWIGHDDELFAEIEEFLGRH